MITEETVRKWYKTQDRYVISVKNVYDCEPTVTVWDCESTPCKKLNQFINFGHALAWLYVQENGLTISTEKGKGIDLYI